MSFHAACVNKFIDCESDRGEADIFKVGTPRGDFGPRTLIEGIHFGASSFSDLGHPSVPEHLGGIGGEGG